MPDLADELKITADRLPTFIFFRDGKELDKLVEPTFKEVDDSILELSGLHTGEENEAKEMPESDLKGKPEIKNPEQDQGTSSPPRD